MAKKLSTEEVMDYVESEGLCIAILEGVPANAIANGKLKSNWAAAKRYLKNIETILEGDEPDDDDDEL